METKQHYHYKDIDLSQLNRLIKEYENTLSNYDILSKEFVQYIHANPQSTTDTQQMNSFKSQLEYLNNELVSLNSTILSSIQKLYPSLEQNISTENIEAQQLKNKYDALLLQQDIINREKEQIQSIQINTSNTNLRLEQNRSIYAFLLFIAFAILGVIIYLFANSSTSESGTASTSSSSSPFSTSSSYPSSSSSSFSNPFEMKGGAKKNYFMLAILFVSLFFVARRLS